MSEEYKLEHNEASFNAFNFYFSPKGRIGRAQYWLGSIPLVIAFLGADYFITEEHVLPYLAIILPVAIMGLILNIKRAQDRDRSGWFVILFFIPIISLWPTIELGFCKGTLGQNRFGSDPLPLSQ